MSVTDGSPDDGTSRAGARRRTHRRTHRGDRGAVAVLVSLLLSTVLLVVGALTVDLGSAWAERAGLDSVAESAALAGAAELPWDASAGPLDPALETRAIDEAVRVLCKDGNRRPSWAASTCAGGTGWARNDDLTDGEVDVTPAEPGLFAVAADRQPWVLRVVTPSVTVRFGLAQAFGVSSTDVRAAAGARPGLPYPVDSPIQDSPYYLTLDDLRTGPDRNGWTCLRTSPVPVQPSIAPSAPVGAAPGFTVGVLDRTTLTQSELDAPGAVVLTLNRARFGAIRLPPGLPLVPSPVRVFVGDAGRPLEVQPARVLSVVSQGRAGFRIRFEAPEGLLGPVKVWFVHTDPFAVPPVFRTSSATDLQYPPDPAAGLPTVVGDCDSGQDGRGLVLPPETDPRPLSETLSTGLATRLHPFGSWPQPQGLPGPDTDCTDHATRVDPTAVVVPDQPGAAEDANCVPVLDGARVPPDEATRGWFGGPSPGDPPGRLQTVCSGSRSLDQTDLFARSSGLVKPGTSSVDLRARISAGLPADAEFQGTITRKAFRCPRLLLVPVLDVTRPVATGDRYAVVGHTYFYVWDSVDRGGRPRVFRGLITDQNSAVIGIRGWVIDPGYLEGADWVGRTVANPDAALPMSIPERAVLVRTPCDDHPESAPC